MTGLRPLRRVRAPSLVPLIDVLFILLIYFMVTSVYLDLDMIPASSSVEDASANTAAPGQAADADTLLVRIDRQGRAVINGGVLPIGSLAAALAETVAVRGENVTVLLMPSPYAPMQSLATALDAVAQSGASGSQVLHLDVADP